MQNRIYDSHVRSIFELDSWHIFKGQLCLNGLSGSSAHRLSYFCGLVLNVFLYRLQEFSCPVILLWVVLLRQLEAKFRFQGRIKHCANVCFQNI